MARPLATVTVSVPLDHRARGCTVADDWQTKKVDDVKAGDVVRYAGQEFTVARVDAPFLGRDEMVCLIEDSAQRWHAYPAGLGGDVEVRAS
jgi:hypothetical protein